MPTTLTLFAPPHITHWTIFLAWLIEEVVGGGGLFTRADLLRTQRAIIRCHPLYERFIAANSVTEEELTALLVMQAGATIRIKEDLVFLPTMTVTLEGQKVTTPPGLLPPWFKVVWAPLEEDQGVSDEQE